MILLNICNINYTYSYILMLKYIKYLYINIIIKHNSCDITMPMIIVLYDYNLIGL